MPDYTAEFYSAMERLGMDTAALLESQKLQISEEAILNMILAALVNHPGWAGEVDKVEEWRAKISPSVQRGIERWKNPTKA